MRSKRFKGSGPSTRLVTDEERRQVEEGIQEVRYQLLAEGATNALEAAVALDHWSSEKAATLRSTLQVTVTFVSQTQKVRTVITLDGKEVYRGTLDRTVFSAKGDPRAK